MNNVEPGHFLGLGGLEEVRFRGAVRPGDRLVIVGKGVRVHRRQTIFDVQGFVNNELVFHAASWACRSRALSDSESRRDSSYRASHPRSCRSKNWPRTCCPMCRAAAPAPPIVWRDLFGNDHPVEVEVGFGKGLFLTTAGAGPAGHELPRHRDRPQVPALRRDPAGAGDD